MHLDFWEVLSNLVGLFLLIAVGYGAVRLDILPASSSAVLSRLLMKITLPCTVFTSLLRPYEASFLRKILVVIALGVVLILANALAARILAPICRVEPGRRGTWSMCATFCNNGFMGFPIALALFGEDGLSLAAVFGLPFCILVYTMGAAMICSDRAAGAEGGEKVDWRGVLLTGINLSTLLGMVFYFAGLSVPSALLTPMTHLSNITTPLSMFVTGMNLCGGNFGRMFRNRDALTAGAARLLVMPLLSFALLKVLDRLVVFGDPLIIGVVFIIMAMPAPAVATILCENYGVGREFSASVVFLSSLFCILTIPAMAMLL